MGNRFTSYFFKHHLLLSILVLASGLPGQTAQAARRPTAAEAAGLRQAIANIESVGGYSLAVGLLRQKLALGALLVEDAWDDSMSGQTSYPIVGNQTITISAKKIPNLLSRNYTGRFGAAGLFEDQTWLASVMVHEWFHTTQSYLFVHTVRWNVEPPAWRFQVKFLKKIVQRVQGQDVFIRDRAEGLVERAQYEVDYMAGRVHD